MLKLPELPRTGPQWGGFRNGLMTSLAAGGWNRPVTNCEKSRKRRSGLGQGTFQNSFLPVKEFSFHEILMILHIIETQNFIWQRHSVLPTELSKYPMTKMTTATVMPKKCHHYQHCCLWTESKFKKFKEHFYRYSSSQFIINCHLSARAIRIH